MGQCVGVQPFREGDERRAAAQLACDHAVTDRPDPRNGEQSRAIGSGENTADTIRLIGDA